MCGIVAYFGGAGNNLTRVLTGMSAIIYRAPDSTGLAIFGDDNEPVRTRKAVGSVESLVEELLDNGALLLSKDCPSINLKKSSKVKHPIPHMMNLSI